MNDISVQIEESPKSLKEVVGSPSTLAVAENEFDPLAIDEVVDAVKVPEVEVKAEEEKAGSCDDDAKEKITATENGEVNEVKEKISLETEIVKDVKAPSPVKKDIEVPDVKNESKTEQLTETPNNPEIPAKDKPKPEIPVERLPEPTPRELEPTLRVPEPTPRVLEPTPRVPEHTPRLLEPTPRLLEPALQVPEPTLRVPVPIPRVPEPTLRVPEPTLRVSEPALREPVPAVKEKVIEKAPSPVKELQKVKEVEKSKAVEDIKVTVKIEVPDQEMTEVAKVEEKIEPTAEQKPTTPMNGDIPKDEQGTKRRASEEAETDSPLKKLCQEVEKTFPQHDGMVTDYITTATKNNIDEVQRHTEQLLSEIQTLRELAQKKEHEWNSILHLKKVKEEILLRLLRRKQVLSYERAPAEVNGQDPFDYLNQAKNLAIEKSDDISGLAIKQPGITVNPMMQPPVMPMSPYNPMAGLPPPYDKAQFQNMPKPVFPQQLMLPGPHQGFPRDMNGQLPNYALPMGRQGPTKDVKSIIADYRQRNPDITPRRGRRMKSILNPNMMNNPRAIAPKMDSLNNLNNLANMSNMANMNNMNNMANMNNIANMNSMANMNIASMNNMASMNNINMIFNNLDMPNQKAMLERLQLHGNTMPNGMSFKDVLVQYANMQQNNPALIPNRVENIPIRPEQHARPEGRRRPDRPERTHEEQPHKPERHASASPNPRLPPPPPYPEISLHPVPSEPSQTQQQNSLLHGILTKQTSPAPQSYSPTLAKLLTSPERKGTALPAFGQAKNCGEITITPVQPTPPPPEPEKAEDVVQLDDDESPGSEGEAAVSPNGSGRLVIDEAGADTAEAGADTAEAAGEPDGGYRRPLFCQGCKRKDAMFVCAGCANQWYCSRECQVEAWDDHSDVCTG